MNITLGLRAVILLAFVVASTSVIVKPELIGGDSAVHTQPLHTVVAISHS